MFVFVLRSSFLPLLAVSSACFLSGCGSYGNEDAGGYGDIYGGGGESPSAAAGGDPQGSNGPAAGTLTAGDWDDNLNFDVYQSYVSEFVGKSQVPLINSADRVVITVTTEAGEPVSNARVEVSGSGGLILSIPTASDGRALFLPSFDGADGEQTFTVKVLPPAGQSGVDPVTLMLGTDKSEWPITLPGASQELPSALDLAFVVDATASMGDELEYLKAEIDGIASDVHEAFGQVDVRYGLVVYRDQGDAYVTRSFDFTTDLSQFKADLGKQSADGGGDEPEAMEAALIAANQLTWRDGNTARVAFLIADAPTHGDRRDEFVLSANEARLAGVKLYPVAASGVSSDAEFQMRNAAQASLGRYLFLTDDSGVGNAHEEPHIPCYHVQLLKKVVNRMVASELAGERIEPISADILRTVGNPQHGICAEQESQQ